MEGRTAGLAEQDRPNLFTQEIGNIPPGVEVVAELAIDQRLQWLPEGAWEWRFPTVVAPRYLGSSGRVGDADRATVDMVETELPVTANTTLMVRDRMAEGHRPESPSHGVRVAPEDGGLAVTLGSAGDAGGKGTPGLDRDLVVRWAAAGPGMGLSLLTGRPAAGRPHADSAYGLLTIVPPAPSFDPAALTRDVIVLLDTSGSMDGAPLEQARRVVAALVETLADFDQLEMIEFSSQPRRWKRQPQLATAHVRQEALRWLAALRAGGGTEMQAGVAEALRPLRPTAQRQVVLVTDGLVGFESEIVATIARELPAGSRLHAVAVGSAPNRALTGPAARAGRGVEVVTGLGEDAGPAIVRLMAQMRDPLLTEVEVSGSAVMGVAPARLPDVYAGAPLRAAVKLHPEGGLLSVRGKTPDGAWEKSIDVPAVATGQASAAVVSLYGREAVEDLEMRRAAGLQADADRAIERIGLDFQIATRLTSWVAVSEEPAVDPTQPARRERIPHALPAGLSAEGLGLRSAILGRPRSMLRMALAHPGAPREVHRSGIADTMWAVLAEPRPPILPYPPRVGRGLRSLTGRLVLRQGREITIEIDVNQPFEWDPVAVEVTWPDSTKLEAGIAWERTTRQGPVEAGQVIRLGLCLKADGPFLAPSQFSVTTGKGEVLTVSLRDAGRG